jgi:hypothetical protein
VSSLHDLKVTFTSNEKLATFLNIFLPNEESLGEKADGTAVEAYIYDKCATERPALYCSSNFHISSFSQSMLLGAGGLR